MFIKVTKNSAGQRYYHLVESYWQDGSSKQRTLLSLGKVKDGKLEALAHALAKQTETLSILEMAQTIEIKDTFIYGPVVVLERLFEKHGINQILTKIQTQHERLELNLREVIFTLVASRFVKPSSKLKIYEHYQRQFHPELVKSEQPLHHIYRALDVLEQHKDEIEHHLFYHTRDLFNLRVDVVLYDLTTLRFESTKNEQATLRRFGYSKEMRADCTQVILGLLVDPEGIPLGFEVYPGNTFEGQTLPDVVKKIREKFNVRRFILVGDRGLFSNKNLQVFTGEEAVKKTTGSQESTASKRITDPPGEFIVGMKLGLLKSRESEFYDRSHYRWLKEGELAIYETTYQGKRCIITWSYARAKRDEKTREDILIKLRKKLIKNPKAKDFVTHSSYRRYIKGLEEDGTQPSLDEKAIEKDKKRDGFFGVVTNVMDMKAEDIVAQYKNLWIVEDVFGEIKGTLKARPIFHWTDKRIVGHLTMCFLAYLCEAHLTKSLRDQKITLKSQAIENNTIDKRPLTASEAMRELSEVRSIPVRIYSKTLWVRTDITGNAAKVFKALNIKIPPKVLNLSQLKKELDPSSLF